MKKARLAPRPIVVAGTRGPDQKSIPPMPPPGGIGGGGVCFFGASATMASVVTNRPATDAASCSAARTTLAGSTMPLSTRSTYSSLWASKPKVSDLCSMILPTTIEPSTPEFSAILHVGIAVGDLADRLLGAQQRDAAARHDPFLDRGAGGVERVLDPVLLLLHLDLGGAADADHRHAARELGQPLLQLLAVIVGRGLLDLRLDLADAGLDVLLLAGAVDDRGLLLLDDDLLGAPEHGGRHVLELDAEFLRNELAAGEDRDVLEHGLAAVAEAGGFDGGDLESAAKLVDDEGGERLALHVLGHDQQRLAGLDDRLEHREHRLQPRELLLVQQDEGVLKLGHHLLGIGDEVRREITAVELHAFDDLDFGVERLGFLHGDHAFVADLLHRLGDHLADLGVAVRRERADLGDLGG